MVISLEKLLKMFKTHTCSKCGNVDVITEGKEWNILDDGKMFGGPRVTEYSPEQLLKEARKKSKKSGADETERMRHPKTPKTRKKGKGKKAEGKLRLTKYRITRMLQKKMTVKEISEETGRHTRSIYGAIKAHGLKKLFLKAGGRKMKKRKDTGIPKSDRHTPAFSPVPATADQGQQA